MFAYPLRAAALAVTAAIGLSACTTGYGYNGVSVGVGMNSGYYDPYYAYGYDIPVYRYGAGYPYYGWYDGFYYPGTGFYVYDRYRRAHRWNDAQRRYWELRRQRAVRDSNHRGVIRERWDGFRRDATQNRQVARSVDRTVRVERPARAERKSSRAERSSVRSERRSDSREQRTNRGRNRDQERER